MNKEIYEFPIDSTGVAQFPTHTHTQSSPSWEILFSKGRRTLAANIARISVISVVEAEVEEEEASRIGENVRCERNDRKQIPLDEREMNI